MGTHRECAKWCSTFICGSNCVHWVALFSGKKQNVVEYFHVCVCIWSIHHILKKKHILLTRAQSFTWLLMWIWNIYNHWCMIKCTDIRYIVNQLSFFWGGDFKSNFKLILKCKCFTPWELPASLKKIGKAKAYGKWRNKLYVSVHVVSCNFHAGGGGYTWQGSHTHTYITKEMCLVIL